MLNKIYNFKEFLDFYCKKNNKNIYYIGENNDEDQIKYCDLLKILKNFEYFLKIKRIKKKSKILVMLDNSKSLLIIYLSILYNQRIFIPINPNSGLNEISYIIKKTNPNFFITDKIFFKKVKKITKIKTYFINHKKFIYDIAKIKFDKPKENKKIYNDNIAQILFTSGSTGNPKGVVLTHKSMLTNLYDINTSLNLKIQSPKFLSVTPLYHNNGQFIPTLLPFILSGSTFSISPETSLINFWPICIKYKINYSSVMATHINYFNTQEKILNHSLKSLFCGGAKLDKSSQKLFEKKFGTKILCNYGLTETSSIASTESTFKKQFLYGSVGKPLKNNKIKIMKFNKKYGEIWVKGNNIFKSYLEDKKLTSLKFNNGWFKTGDLGYFDKNKYLFIKDRIDNMIIVSGENIYPLDIETHLYKFRDIKLGIISSIPDKITQNKLVMIYESKKIVSYDKFYNFLKTKISKFKIPKIIINVKELGISEIPKAPNKKILRKKINLLISKFLFK